MSDSFHYHVKLLKYPFDCYRLGVLQSVNISVLATYCIYAITVSGIILPNDGLLQHQIFYLRYILIVS